MSDNSKSYKRPKQQPQRRQPVSHLERLIAETLAIEAETAEEAGAIGYMARALVQATLPHKATTGTTFMRRNGNFSLVMMARPDVGLPYGSIPRLLMAWMTTEAIRTKDPVLVLGPTLSGFLKQLGLLRSGGIRGDIRRLRDQMRRLFTCAVSCVYEDENNDEILNLQVVEEAKLWWAPKSSEQTVLWRSTVTLGRRFFAEMTTNPVPIDFRVLKALTRSPLAIDIYTWLTYRVSYLKRRTAIPWEALQAQFGASYPLTTQGKRNFKREFLQQLRKVHAIYTQANLEVAEDFLILIPSKPHVFRRRSQ